MNFVGRVVLILICGALAFCFFHALLPGNAQEKQKRQGPLTIVGGETSKPTTPTPRPAVKRTPTPTPTPTPLPTPSPVKLPEIAFSLRPRLVDFFRWEGSGFFHNLPPLIDDTETPKPPPPLIEVFSFKTLTIDNRERVTAESGGQAKFYREYINDDVWLELVEVPAGEFMMGAGKGVTDKDKETQQERPVHKVSIQTFWIGKFEVTQEQWRTVVDLPKVKQDLRDRSTFKGLNLPAHNLSWEDAVEFCARLEKLTGRKYRLPTEAEWEYAASAGKSTPYAFGDTITMKIVNYNGYPFWKHQANVESRRTTITVGSLGVANAFGLFDMHGNVLEWCEDRWHDNYEGAPADGSAWVTGTGGRIARGGGFTDAAANCRSSSRFVYGNDKTTVRKDEQGFRIAVTKPF